MFAAISQTLFGLALTFWHVAVAISLAPVKLIIDTDMSTDVDDVGALAIAHKMADLGDVELLAVVHNTGLPAGVGAISVINHFYRRDDVLIGAYKGSFDNPDGPDAMHDPWVEKKSAGPYVQKLLQDFPSPVQNSSMVLGAVDVYRKVLARQSDHSVVIASIGFLSNLAALLSSGPDDHSDLTGQALVALKVQSLALMGGCYPRCPDNMAYEWNFGGGCQWGSPSCPYTPAWTKVVVDSWPKEVPIAFSGFEMGVQVKTGGRLSECAPRGSPVRVAYEAYKEFDATCPPRESWDPATVLFAVYGLSKWWTRQVGGHVVVDAGTAANHWEMDERAWNQSYLILRPGMAESLAAEIDGLLCVAPGAEHRGFSDHLTVMREWGHTHSELRI